MVAVDMGIYGGAFPIAPYIKQLGVNNGKPWVYPLFESKRSTTGRKFTVRALGVSRLK